MTTAATPQEVAERQVADPQLPPGDAERFVAQGVFGLPFSSGHYLALRVMSQTSIGPGYRALWHRDPAGDWTILTTTDPDLSCPRYFGAACTHIERVDAIDVAWESPTTLRVALAHRLDWTVEVGPRLATRAMSAMGSAMPAQWWHSEPLLGAMGPMATGMLGSGRIRMHGTTPNGPHFRTAPQRIWMVTDTRATLGGQSLGLPAPLGEQTHLADFWLPQRGIFFVGTFEADPVVVPQPATAAPAAA
jgi:hypothetical protein